MEEPKIAILIDGDNISTKYASLIKNEADKYGDITIFRLYGSMNSPSVRQWCAVMPKYGISPVLQLSYANNKSIADQALTIDAMDILYNRTVDIFFLATSDSDFTKLAYRIKESGKTIIGMGEKKTPESLAQACNEFKVLELLLNAETDVHKDGIKSKGNLSPVPDSIPQETDIPIEPKKISIPSEDEIVHMIFDALDDDGENLAVIGSNLSKSVPGFDVRYYRYKTFSALVKAHSDVFEVEEALGPDKVHKVITIKKKTAVAPEKTNSSKKDSDDRNTPSMKINASEGRGKEAPSKAAKKAVQDDSAKAPSKAKAKSHRSGHKRTPRKKQQSQKNG